MIQQGMEFKRFNPVFSQSLFYFFIFGALQTQKLLFRLQISKFDLFYLSFCSDQHSQMSYSDRLHFHSFTLNGNHSVLLICFFYLALKFLHQNLIKAELVYSCQKTNGKKFKSEMCPLYCHYQRSCIYQDFPSLALWFVLLSLLPLTYSLPFHLENEENPMKPGSLMLKKKKKGQEYLEIFILPLVLYH